MQTPITTKLDFALAISSYEDNFRLRIKNDEKILLHRANLLHHNIKATPGKS